MAFDPSLATRLDTSAINDITIDVRWEPDLLPGPIGEYVEVIDYDPASNAFYEPVNLNDIHLVAQDGLAPSESNPQFHQQMVYAVAMATIRHFERALGRVIFWADHKNKEKNEKAKFVRRLRIYPHALRERNAYYSPSKKAILFGYFPVTAKHEGTCPGTLVFTCLSYEIIAHEVTHALLDGIHPRFNEPTNPDVHGFHEAFADIVALFQKFSYPKVIEHQIKTTRGNLDSENLLSKLAHQFAIATGRGSALRDALGFENRETGEWEPRKPDPSALDSTMEPHARGSVLVAAVFRAFLNIYRSRTSDLFRIATAGTGVLPDGDIHPDLAKRLAQQASKSAGQILQMCVRAIDYCPPVDITFGDFLRGIITADLDFAPQDKSGYRIVFIESFREWGIHPHGVLSMGIDSLTWPTGEEVMQNLVTKRKMIKGTRSHQKGRKDYLKEIFLNKLSDWNLESDRLEVWKKLAPARTKLHDWLHQGDSYGKDYASVFGLVIDNATAQSTVSRSDTSPAIEIHAVRPTIRRNIEGEMRTDLVVEITQRRRGYFDKEQQAKLDKIKLDSEELPAADFYYRAGATILIDPKTNEIRRVIKTPGDIADTNQLDRVRSFLLGEPGEHDNSFDSGISASLSHSSESDEPFALLHQPHHH